MRRSLIALHAAFLSPTALACWLLSAVLFAGAVALLGPVTGGLVGAVLAKLTYIPTAIAGVLAFVRSRP